VVFVADDLAAWLVGLLADAGRRRLTTWLLGSDQERELRSAATAAVQLTVAELRPEGGDRAEELAMVVSQVFSAWLPDMPLTGHGTLLEALQAGIAGQLAPLGDPGLTGTGKSSAEVLEVQATTLADTLFSHLVRAIVIRGARGRPLAPLAAQLNNDVTHLQGQRLEVMIGRLAEEVREALARLDADQAAAPMALAQLPASVAGFPGRDGELAMVSGPLEDLKSFLYGLFVEVGSPDVTKIVDTISADLYRDLPLQLSSAAVNDCINSPDLPGWETTLSVGGALITLAMDRPHASASPGGGDQPDQLSGRSGQSVTLPERGGFSVPQRPAVGAKRLEKLFGFWKAAAWHTAMNDQFKDDPQSWHTLVVARLDELGVAAAQSTVDKWRDSAPIDSAWLPWIDSLIQLTAEGRLRPVTRRALPVAGGGPFLGREQQAAELNGFLDRVQQGRGGLALILGPAGMGKSRLLVEVLSKRVSRPQVEWVALDRQEAGYRGWRRLLGPPWITLRRTELAPAQLLAHTETLDDTVRSTSVQRAVGRCEKCTQAGGLPGRST
jgi:AAA ATPase domain